MSEKVKETKIQECLRTGKKSLTCSGRSEGPEKRVEQKGKGGTIMMRKTIEIMFEDLVETKKREVLEKIGIEKPQDMGYFLKPSGENLTGSFCSGVRGTRSSGLLSR